MCGCLGIVSQQSINQEIYDGLTMLQHRGQDAAGMMTHQDGKFYLRKANGLVRDVFKTKHMMQLKGTMGIGHVRYPTAGTSHEAEAQPFYVNAPYGIALVHNGNLINTTQLRQNLIHQQLRHLNTSSDSELILNIFASALQKTVSNTLTPDKIFQALTEIYASCHGAFAVVLMIAGVGMVGFRDPFGIRPLSYGVRGQGRQQDVMIASESVALNALGFHDIKDIQPGEGIFVSTKGEVTCFQCVPQQYYAPCMFEYVYFARPDSVMDGISVYEIRVKMGEYLAEKIKRDWSEHDIDVVIPVPETSRHAALSLAHHLNLPYREGLVKNRYIARTFIMPWQQTRKKSVRQKLNTINREFYNKNVLLVDDSIVRGTTSKEIVQLAREAGANKVYFASSAPKVLFPNVYGIDMAVRDELIANQYPEEHLLASALGVDKIIYQDLADLIEAARFCNPKITHFENSVFDGHYITGAVDEPYLIHLAKLRKDSEKCRIHQDSKQSDLEFYNQRS